MPLCVLIEHTGDIWRAGRVTAEVPSVVSNALDLSHDILCAFCGVTKLSFAGLSGRLHEVRVGQTRSGSLRSS